MIKEFHRKLSKSNTFPLFIRLPLISISSWGFQGILYMNKSEVVFKALLELIFLIISFFILYFYLDKYLAFLISLATVHIL